MNMITPEGTYANYPCSVIYYENPAYHMAIFDVIRFHMNHLKNRKMEQEMKRSRKGRK